MKPTQQNMNIFDESEVLMKVNNWTVYKSYIRKGSRGNRHYLFVCSCGSKRYHTLRGARKHKWCNSCSNTNKFKLIKVGKKIRIWTAMQVHKIINKNNRNKIYQKFKCNCGYENYFIPKTILSGRKCDKCERHGLSLISEYVAWHSMKQRCDNVKGKNFYRYGGRGIKYPHKWKKFIGFFEDMGKKPSPELELDRIDNDKDYSKENCRWATKKQNVNNRNTSQKYKTTAFKQSIIDQIKITLTKYKIFYEHEKTSCIK